MNPRGRARGLADPSQRLSARELAELLGLPGAEEMNEAKLAEDAPVGLTEQEQRFQRQLGDQNGPKVAGAVTRLLDHWRALGGNFQYGTAANARW